MYTLPNIQYYSTFLGKAHETRFVTITKRPQIKKESSIEIYRHKECMPQSKQKKAMELNGMKSKEKSRFNQAYKLSSFSSIDAVPGYSKSNHLQRKNERKSQKRRFFHIFPNTNDVNCT